MDNSNYPPNCTKSVPECPLAERLRCELSERHDARRGDYRVTFRIIKDKPRPDDRSHGAPRPGVPPSITVGSASTLGDVETNTIDIDEESAWLVHI